MTELKPCPFCGGEAVLCENTDYAYVYCKECGSQTDESHGTAGAAVAAWNTRAERTCHINWDKELFCFVCDSCDYISMMAPDSRPTYCPNCGAKVVHE